MELRIYGKREKVRVQMVKELNSPAKKCRIYPKGSGESLKDFKGGCTHTHTCIVWIWVGDAIIFVFFKDHPCHSVFCGKEASRKN